MRPARMPDHWFQQYLAQLTPPGRSPLRPHDETLKLWRASVHERAQRQWDEAFLTGAVEGVKVRPARMEIVCDQDNCRLADLPRKD
jgi:hypothetical protein